jgi:hypothetical protein
MQTHQINSSLLQNTILKRLAPNRYFIECVCDAEAEKRRALVEIEHEAAKETVKTGDNYCLDLLARYRGENGNTRCFK